jgi:phytoene dehydrogenase-like protein
MTKEIKSYDAVIIGGGLGGITLSAYLQRAGMRVAVFEKRYEEGSGIHTFEPTAPGFLCNHAQWGEFFPRWAPTYFDFGLKELGAEFVVPEVQAGIAFSDGRPPIVLYNIHLEDGFERSRRSIAVHSKHDADTWVEFRRASMGFEHMFYEWWFNPPPMPSAEDPDPYNTLNNTLMDLFGMSRHFAKGTTKDVIDYLFESREMRTLMYKLAPEWMAEPEMMATGAWALMAMFSFGSANQSVSIGGTHTVAHAAVMAAIREGVHFHESSKVTGIVIKNGRAEGITLEDGTQVKAEKLVASCADLRQTLLQLVGEDKLSPTWVKRAQHFKCGPEGVLGSSMMALHEAPDYKSARHDPAINRCSYTVAGFDEPEQVLQHCRERLMGKVPEIPGVGCTVNSLFDPTYAPAGKHVWQGWLFFPKASCLTREEWAQVKATYNDRILDWLRRWAPNMTQANVIADHFVTPLDLQEEKGMIEGDYTNGAFIPSQTAHNRPFPEAAMYRTEIDRLYLAGAFMHPAGGIAGGVGYNVYKVICEDFGLKYRPWETREQLGY